MTKGGTAPNTIAEYAEVVFDLRFADNKSRQHVLADIRALCDKGFMEGVKSELVPPKDVSALEETEASRKLMAVVDQAAQELGQNKPQWLTVGGASDGNKFSAQGAAVVCAMGVVSGNLHHPSKEWSDLSTASRRIALSKRTLELLAKQK